MHENFDQQHTRAYLSTLPTTTLIARLDLLQALLEDLRTFSSLSSLELDLHRWISAHHVICVERDPDPLDAESLAIYRLIRFIAFGTSLRVPIGSVRTTRQD